MRHGIHYNRLGKQYSFNEIAFDPCPAQRSSVCGTSPSRIVVPLCPSQGRHPVIGYHGAVKVVGALSESFPGDWRKPVRSLVLDLFESTSSGPPAEWERERESRVRLRKLNDGRYVDSAILLFGRCILNSGFVLFVKHT